MCKAKWPSLLRKGGGGGGQQHIVHWTSTKDWILLSQNVYGTCNKSFNSGPKFPQIKCNRRTQIYNANLTSSKIWWWVNISSGNEMWRDIYKHDCVSAWFMQFVNLKHICIAYKSLKLSVSVYPSVCQSLIGRSLNMTRNSPWRKCIPKCSLFFVSTYQELLETERRIHKNVVYTCIINKRPKLACITGVR